MGRLALGSYSSVSLSAARLARDRVKVGKAEGVDPIEARRQANSKNETAEASVTFKAIASDTSFQCGAISGSLNGEFSGCGGSFASCCC